MPTDLLVATMVVGKVTLEYPVAVSVELLWKVAFSGDVSIFTKACVGMIDDVEFDGHGGPGSVTTMKLNPVRYQARNKALGIVSPVLA